MKSTRKWPFLSSSFDYATAQRTHLRPHPTNMNPARPKHRSLPSSLAGDSPRRRFLQRLGAGLSTSILCESAVAADSPPKPAGSAANAPVAPPAPVAVINITNVG